MLYMHTVSAQLHICHTHKVKNIPSYWMMTSLYTIPSHFFLQFAFKKSSLLSILLNISITQNISNYTYFHLQFTFSFFSGQLLPYPQPGILECFIDLMNSISQGSYAFWSKFPPLKIEFCFLKLLQLLLEIPKQKFICIRGWKSWGGRENQHWTLVSKIVSRIPDLEKQIPFFLPFLMRALPEYTIILLLSRWGLQGVF